MKDDRVLKISGDYPSLSFKSTMEKLRAWGPDRIKF